MLRKVKSLNNSITGGQTRNSGSLWLKIASLDSRGIEAVERTQASEASEAAEATEAIEAIDSSMLIRG